MLDIGCCFTFHIFNDMITVIVTRNRNLKTKKVSRD